MTGWVSIEDAPVEALGVVWSPRFPDRNDFLGVVRAYSDGSRFVSSQSAQNVEFTLWHPLPALPGQRGEP